MLQNNNTRFVTYHKPEYFMVYIIVCLLFVSVGIWFVVSAHSLALECIVDGVGRCFRNPVSYYIMGALSILLFGIICLPIFIYRFIKPKPIFYMNDDGFYYSNLGFIKWSDVTDIELLKKNNGKYIVFKMKKREAVREIVSFHSLGIYIDNVYTLGFCGTGINIEKVYMEMKKANEQKN